MKRLTALMLAALMTLSMVSGVAEGLNVEYDWTGGQAVSSEGNGAETTDGDEIIAENADLFVDEVEEVLLSEPDTQIEYNSAYSILENDEASSSEEHVAVDAPLDTSEMCGVWTGTYVGTKSGNYIERAFRLDIDYCNNGSFEGIATIDEGASGSYLFSGTLNTENCEITFQGTDWIENPGNMVFSYYSGVLDETQKSIQGTADGSAERTFSLSKTSDSYVSRRFDVQKTPRNWKGEYDGSHEAKVVRRNCEMQIQEIDTKGNISGEVIITPSEKTDASLGLRGSYYFEGKIDGRCGKITIQGKKWIVEPENLNTWEFVQLEGFIDTSLASISGCSEEGIWDMKATDTGLIPGAEAELPNLTEDSKSIAVNETFQLLAEDSPVAAADCKFSSSNKKIATVNDKGIVTGVKPGTVKITVKHEGEISRIKVTVRKEQLPTLPITIRNNHGNSAVFKKSLDSYILKTKSTKYSPDLSYMLCALAAAAYNDTGKQTGKLTVSNAGYKSKSGELQYITKAYEDLGFLDYKPYSYYNSPNASAYGTDNCAFVIGQKQLTEDEHLVLIVMRGSYGSVVKLTKDWKSNFKIGVNGANEHIGFAKAADKVYKSVMSFLNDRFTDKEIRGKLRFVLTGHSRGAAVSNLLAVRLGKAGVSKSHVYSYNYACPDTARSMVGNWKKGHENIFNICHTADAICIVPGVLGDGLYTLLKKKVQSLFVNWGKYGTTYFYCNNWKDKSEFDLARTIDEPNSPHDYKYYVRDLGKKPAKFYTWAKVTARRAALGLSGTVETVARFFYPDSLTQPRNVALKKEGYNSVIKAKAGERIQLKAKFAENNGWKLKSWSSSNEKVATVSSEGLVTALKKGTVTITITTKNGREATVKIKVAA